MTTASPYTHDLTVTGMTCAHCVASVTEELEALPEVESVTVQLVPGGESTVQVTATAPLPAAAAHEAVAEAGYTLVRGLV